MVKISCIWFVVVGCQVYSSVTLCKLYNRHVKSITIVLKLTHLQDTD